MAGKRVNTSPDTMPALQMESLFAFGAVERIIGGTSRNGSHVLSDREREVLRWIADGKSQEQVGKLLSISKRTVEEHIRNVRRKLGAVNTAHAVAQALSTGEIQL